MNNYSVYLYVLVMAVVTYLVRMLPITLFRKEIKNRFLRSALYYMPYACLACMTVPAIWHSTASVISGIAGLIAALIAAFLNRSMVTVALLSCGTVFVVERIIDFAS